jgi:hypothetical protein
MMKIILFILKYIGILNIVVVVFSEKLRSIKFENSNKFLRDISDVFMRYAIASIFFSILSIILVIIFRRHYKSLTVYSVNILILVVHIFIYIYYFLNFYALRIW